MLMMMLMSLQKINSDSMIQFNLNVKVDENKVQNYVINGDVR